jgi:nucleoside-diphosphate-sugar epimerase
MLQLQRIWAILAKMAGVKRYVYASSCSVYGHTENDLYDETRPAGSSYPYGISKLQGEQAVLQLISENFSVISLRKGTISGYCPRAIVPPQLEMERAFVR